MNRREFIRNAVSGLFVMKAAPIIFDLGANKRIYKTKYFTYTSMNSCGDYLLFCGYSTEQDAYRIGQQVSASTAIIGSRPNDHKVTSRTEGYTNVWDMKYDVA